MKFTAFEISANTLRGLNRYGFEEATEIQRKVIPPMLSGRSIVGQAKTGSGKTLAFGIPILERLKPNLRKVQAVIICPIRELAKQIAEEISKAATFTNFKTVTIYGGVSYKRQLDKIRKGAQIIAATPGRLLDHLKQGLKIKPNIIILDEADKMFEMGFYEDVRRILRFLKSKYPQQFGFFGATLPDPIVKLARQYTNNPVIITIRQKHEERIPKSISQEYYICAETSDKFNLLIKILTEIQETNNDIPKILIFVKTRVQTRRLADELSQMGFPATSISSDMKQFSRERTLEAFQSTGMILVATDVLARGIDIEDITHVINYDVPRDIKSYVHRIGRTGRMGKSGRAITFIVPEELDIINEIEETYQIRLKKRYIQRHR
ncbi:MAG: DEAD/DEAH box helicase [Candidatus Helarchaeota archaeon]